MLKNKVVNIVITVLLLATILADTFSEVSVWVYVGIILLYSIIQVIGSFVLSAQFFVPVKFQGKPSGNRIAITFDDGPVPGKTEKILDILSAKKVLAAFFCVGHRVKENPDLTARIHQDGHVLGNHSYWHGKMFDLQPREKIWQELEDTKIALEKTAGVKSRFFRPPYGVTNPMVASAIRKGGYTTIGWSLRSFDTVTKDTSILFHRVTRSLKAGDIILFHDYCESTIEILPAVLDHVAQVGLKIVRVDELLNERAYE